MKLSFGFVGVAFHPVTEVHTLESKGFPKPISGDIFARLPSLFASSLCAFYGNTLLVYCGLVFSFDFFSGCFLRFFNGVELTYRMAVFIHKDKRLHFINRRLCFLLCLITLAKCPTVYCGHKNRIVVGIRPSLGNLNIPALHDGISLLLPRFQLPRPADFDFLHGFPALLISGLEGFQYFISSKDADFINVSFVTFRINYIE